MGNAGFADTPEVTIIVSLSSAVIGVVIGAIVSGLITRMVLSSRARTDRAYEMHREFFSTEFNDKRAKCLRLIRTCPERTIQEIYNNDIDEGNNFWYLFAFYRRLSVAIDTKEISRREAASLFGQIFFWWYYVAFRNKIDDFPDEKEEMEKLHTWMVENAPPGKQKRWIENAQKEARQIHLANSRQPIA